MDLIEIDEKYNVIAPVLKQLESLGWKIIQGDEYDAGLSLRAGFNEVVLEKELRTALMRMNPWLQEDQVNDIVRAVTFVRVRQIPEANEEISLLLQRSITVAENRKTGERNPSISFIDIKNPENNSYVAIAQYKVQVPGTGKYIIPDIVLFINGFPLVVIECKSSYLGDPITKAIQQIKRYSNQNGNNDGNELLFHYNQILIAADGQTAKYGTITSQEDDFEEWKDPYPKENPSDPNEVLTSQQTLIYGMLSTPNLLHIIRSYITFRVNEKGKLTKIIARYPQFRAVQKMIMRIKTGDTLAHKGGIIYHACGSGKSVTMTFAARRIYRDPDLLKYKVVLVTDKKWIEQMLEKSAFSARFTLRKALTVNELQEVLKAETPELILCMMSNYQERELLQEFPVLNSSNDIIIMIDEAHRSRYKWLTAHLQRALPNAVKIVFTGTPLEPFQSDKDPYIDRYSIKEASKDGVILDINYETRIETSDEYSVSSKDKSCKEFKDMFAFTAEDDKKRAGERTTRRQYMESQEVIRDKAGDMLRHYLNQIFPNKFKAQIVTSSHFAAVRYKQELDRALYDYINQFNVIQNPYIDVAQLKKLKTAVIITKSVQDPPAYRPFTDENEHKKNIASFLLPFGQTQGQITGDVGIIIVTDMLLLGFEAPLEQVIYLDQVLKDHQLLEAIARVNRPYLHKNVGIFIDYAGIITHFKDAMAAFDFKDQDEILDSFRNTNNNCDLLKFSNQRIHEFFKGFDVLYMEDTEKCINALSEGKSRNEFQKLYREFLEYLDRVLPQLEGQALLEDLKLITFICYGVRLRYRDDSMGVTDVSPKLHKVLDDFLNARQIDLKVTPVPVFSKQFDSRLNSIAISKSKSTEIEYALREYCEEQRSEDPELFDRFSEKLEKIVSDNKDKTDALKLALLQFLEEVRKGRSLEENIGLETTIELPFFSLLMYLVFGVHNYKQLTDNQFQLLLELIRKMIPVLRKEIQQVNFWSNIPALRKLKAILMISEVI